MSSRYIFEKINIPRFAGTLLFAGTIASIAWAVYFSAVTISIPYQIEFREGAAMVTTKILLGGGNPYVFENQPLGLNVYGVAYSLVTLPFAFLFGNTLSVHRTVTFVFILLSALITAGTIYKVRKNVSLSFGCGAFVMVGLISLGGGGAFPSAMGSFLFLVAVLAPFVRSFDRWGLFVSILSSVVAFYTKPYFVLSVGVVAIYLFLFVSKWKSILYGSILLVLFTICYLVTQVVFPLYFMNVIVGNVFLTVRSPETLLNNLEKMFLNFYPILALSVAVGVKGLLVATDSEPTGRKGKHFFNLLNMNQPLILRTANYLFFSFSCSFAAFVCILGSHGGGTGMNYMYQLLSPLFFVWFFTKMDLGSGFSLILVSILLGNLFFWESEMLNPEMLKQKDSKGWAELFDYVEESSNILNSQITVSKTVEVGLNPIDSGQTIIFYQIRPFSSRFLSNPSYEAIRVDGFQYVVFIDRAIERKLFDLIITTEEKAAFFHVKRLSENYSVVAEIVVEMPQTGQTWTALIWKPLAEYSLDSPPSPASNPAIQK